MSDLGFTHVALPVTHVDASIAFYSKYARMQVVHRRTDQTTQSDVVWLGDLTRPFCDRADPNADRRTSTLTHRTSWCSVRDS
jgi:catechol 2,3-dioxygenase-like lactoylglutathione lyase family enzyme